jgi:thiosulfate/3-mercaptopyruvate sulfurtransferase
VSSERDVYKKGHIAGSLFVNCEADLTSRTGQVKGQVLKGDALSEVLGKLGVSKEDTVVFYDDASSLFASRAYWVLRYFHHPDVRIYNGGINMWLAEGGQLTTKTPVPTPSEYRAGSPYETIRTTWKYVLDHLNDESTALCDTRTEDEYTGKDRYSKHGGHIPGAIRVDWQDSANGNGTFKDGESLRELYLNAGFHPRREVITYCQLGIRAAHSWFVLHELLGYRRVRNYDGSWEEWGNSRNLPIEKEGLRPFP